MKSALARRWKDVAGRGHRPGVSAGSGEFTTSEIRERRVRKGFRVATLEGKAAVLAHVGAGEWQVRVDVPTFEHLALVALEDAVLRRRTVVIDEIGKIELASKRFCDVVQ